MAFALFSRIPMPQFEWNENTMRYIMAAFPAVGAVLGACLCGWWLFCDWLGMDGVFIAVGLAIIPVFFTGMIHLEGYADVVDARASHASLERKREILKDPHLGACACIALICYQMVFVTLASELDGGQLLSLACIPVVSRCLSGYATVTFKKFSSTGMLAAEGSTSRAGTVRAILLVIFLLAGGLMLWNDGLAGACALVAALATLKAVSRMAQREFGGMNGDLAGYFLQMAEMVMLACIVIVGRLG